MCKRTRTVLPIAKNSERKKENAKEKNKDEGKESNSPEALESSEEESEEYVGDLTDEDQSDDELLQEEDKEEPPKNLMDMSIGELLALPRSIEKAMCFRALLVEFKNIRLELALAQYGILESQSRGLLLEEIIARLMSEYEWTWKHTREHLKKQKYQSTKVLPKVRKTPTLEYVGRVCTNELLLEYLADEKRNAIYLPPGGRGASGPDIIVRIAKKVLVFVGIKQSVNVVKNGVLQKNRESTQLQTIFPKWDKNSATVDTTQSASARRREKFYKIVDDEYKIIRVHICLSTGVATPTTSQFETKLVLACDRGCEIDFDMFTLLDFFAGNKKVEELLTIVRASHRV